jgi:hypothetical protein
MIGSRKESNEKEVGSSGVKVEMAEQPASTELPCKVNKLDATPLHIGSLQNKRPCQLEIKHLLLLILVEEL